MPTRRFVDFLPFDSRGMARLAIEKAAFGCVDQKLIRIIALCRQVGVKGSVADSRRQDALFAEGIVILSVSLVAALVEIRRGSLRGECIQADVIEFLRVQRE